MGMDDAEEAGTAGDAAERAANQRAKLAQRHAAAITLDELRIFPPGPVRWVHVGEIEKARTRIDGGAGSAEMGRDRRSWIAAVAPDEFRSEERRVGKEGVSVDLGGRRTI